MIIKLFGKQITINNKKWQQDLLAWSLLYRTEIVIAIASFILGFYNILRGIYEKRKNKLV
jgi:hypothetical protein